jgi:hypothetical protein
VQEEETLDNKPILSDYATDESTYHLVNRIFGYEQEDWAHFSNESISSELKYFFHFPMPETIRKALFLPVP